ncbi:MAG: response regulator [Gemmataceae bacterium]
MSEDVKALRHDLRTPFNAILNYAEMLLEDGAGPGEADLRALLGEARALLAWLNAALAGDTDLPALGRELLARLPALSAPVARLLTAGGMSEDAQADLAKLAAAVEALERLARDRLLTGTAAAAPAPAPPPAAATYTQPRVVGSSTVLVVDDQETNRDLMCRRLEREGHAAVQAESGERALELLDGGRFDLVLLDLLMPGMSGYDVLARMKADPGMREVPVIVVSALDELSSVVRCIEMGAEDYLPKPFDPVLLRARVDACLEKKRLRDKELEYFRAVRHLEEAAAAVEGGSFEPGRRDPIAGRDDELGQLARVFQRMASEVKAREKRLEAQVQALRISIDEERKSREVQAITGSSIFEALERKADELRRRRKD